MIEAAGRIPEAQTSGLRQNALPFVETLAQSVANIAPTATPSLTIPLVFASAGNGTWLAFLLATVGLVLVSCCINQFARRSATPGSLYHYVSTGLGERTGLITGESLTPSVQCRNPRPVGPSERVISEPRRLHFLQHYNVGE